MTFSMEEQASLASRPPSVLVVDDEAACRDLLGGWLADAGYRVTTANDGLDAQARLAADPFDLVLTDLRMPRCDGLQLLEHIRGSWPELPVIFMSGQATLAEAISALHEGRSFDFLEKPLHDANRIWRVVQRALEQGRSLHTPPETREIHHVGVRAALTFLRQNLAAPITLGEVADHAGYSSSYMSELMRLETGRTVSEWLTDLRMAEARRLLRETDFCIAQVAEAVGFADTSHFTRRFRTVVGVPPATWRRDGAEGNVGSVSS